jgi:mono/diheme cytochrome c family protein
MKRLALLLASSLAAAAPLAAAAAESGLVVFHTQCSRCHGEDGRGKAIFTTPNFLGSRLGAEEMEQVIATGRAKMPAFKTKLSPDEIKAVAAYIKAGLPPK